eukprot:scaffold86183_cov30-Tisochrysis_lutea.AAC.1
MRFIFVDYGRRLIPWESGGRCVRTGREHGIRQRCAWSVVCTAEQTRKRKAAATVTPDEEAPEPHRRLHRSVISRGSETSGHPRCRGAAGCRCGSLSN